MAGSKPRGPIGRYGETRLLTKEDVVGQVESTNVALGGGMEAPDRRFFWFWNDELTTD